MVVNKDYKAVVNDQIVDYKIDVKTTSAGVDLRNLLNVNDSPFDAPKNTSFIKLLISLIDGNDFTVLDFFSGSSTTAHAIMELNAQDKANRKYIMVQLPECLDESLKTAETNSKKTIKSAINFLESIKKPHLLSEIGKERIRRASKKVKEETNADIDYGFRVYRLDSSNMKEVYYKPQEYNQEQLAMLEDNIKEDRTADDLVAQIMLDWGLPLSLKIEQITVQGKTVYKIGENSLLACFDNNIDQDFIKEIAKLNPLRVVFKNTGFSGDTTKVNAKQLLKQLSPETEMKVI